MFKSLEYFEGRENEIVLVICYDQSKMFDRIEKNQLLRACKNLGIQGNTLFQINEIITNRQVRIKLNNKLSKPVKISNGNPQGLSISLPLSSIYTNGIEKYLEETGKDNENDEKIKKDFGLFIDDTSLIISTTKDDKGIRAAQKVVDAIYRYFKDRNVVLNNKKVR